MKKIVINFIIILLMIHIPFLVVFGWYSSWDVDAKTLFTIFSVIISGFFSAISQMEP